MTLCFSVLHRIESVWKVAFKRCVNVLKGSLTASKKQKMVLNWNLYWYFPSISYDRDEGHNYDIALMVIVTSLSE